MRQRYVYIIMYANDIVAVYTRRATAYARMKEISTAHPDNPNPADYIDDFKLYMTDLATYEAEWRCVKKPIGPPLPSNAKKTENPKEPDAPYLDCDHCIHTSASGMPWCTLRLINTPVDKCQHFERAE